MGNCSACIAPLRLRSAEGANCRGGKPSILISFLEEFFAKESQVGGRAKREGGERGPFPT